VDSCPRSSFYLLKVIKTGLAGIPSFDIKITTVSIVSTQRAVKGGQPILEYGNKLRGYIFNVNEII
jgi:hypothetical protein